MQVFQTNIFRKAIKKLHANQKSHLDQIIKAIISDPLMGAEKAGDLTGVRVYKFFLVNQLNLLAYKYEQVNSMIILLALGSHENFYRDLKNNLN